MKPEDGWRGKFEGNRYKFDGGKNQQNQELKCFTYPGPAPGQSRLKPADGWQGKFEGNSYLQV